MSRQALSPSRPLSPVRRLRGAPRFIVYMALQVTLFSSPFPWLAVPALAVLGLGVAERLGWAGWLRRSWPLLLAAALPALAGFPLAEVLASSWGRAGLPGVWEPSLLRSARLALVLASAAWLSAGMSAIELRDALVLLLRPLGPALAGRVARAASLTMAFIPWTRTELVRADEAARLRGSNPARRPGRHLAALSVPVVSRALDKARHSSDALSLRDPEFGA